MTDRCEDGALLYEAAHYVAVGHQFRLEDLDGHGSPGLADGTAEYLAHGSASEHVVQHVSAAQRTVHIPTIHDRRHPPADVLDVERQGQVAYMS